MTEIYTISETVGFVEVIDDGGAILAVLSPAAEIVQIVTPELTGPRGPIGPIGPQGEIGPAGPFAPTFEQRFNDPSTEWIINHNLNLYPVVNTYDPDGQEISGDVSMPDKNTVVIEWVHPTTGYVILKA